MNGSDSRNIFYLEETLWDLWSKISKLSFLAYEEAVNVFTAEINARKIKSHLICFLNKGWFLRYFDFSYSSSLLSIK